MLMFTIYDKAKPNTENVKGLNVTAIKAYEATFIA